MTQEFETATNDVHNDLHITAEVYMGPASAAAAALRPRPSSTG
jgi:hypothetical protein